MRIANNGFSSGNCEHRLVMKTSSSSSTLLVMPRSNNFKRHGEELAARGLGLFIRGQQMAKPRLYSALSVMAMTNAAVFRP